ncbi:hypothetical protein QBC35DRAFT_490120 [Podospora australis]|uniref:Uncharacterized protein n=1 Tax=Podospora australis TaxID=1536484 RepID=A0AAN7ALD7_9PEZI|nr:hypothetical protein QBC35DRAFT_490120 [Podospora australis]
MMHTTPSLVLYSYCLPPCHLACTVPYCCQITNGFCVLSKPISGHLVGWVGLILIICVFGSNLPKSRKRPLKPTLRPLLVVVLVFWRKNWSNNYWCKDG